MASNNQITHKESPIRLTAYRSMGWQLEEQDDHDGEDSGEKE